MTPPLRLTHIIWDRFKCLEPFQESWLDEVPFWEEYTAAFFRSNGIKYEAKDSNVLEWVRAVDRAPFVKMVEALLPRLAEKAILDDIDLVLLAHWLPDLHLGSSVTNFAMHQLGLSSAFGFAISDRGLSAPFFALDCIEKYLREGRRKALLMVMDQKHLLYKSKLRDALMPDNSACLMLLERCDSPGLTYMGYQRRVPITAENLTANCIAMLDRLSLCRAATTFITSDHFLADMFVQNPVVKANPHLVCAAPFIALADNLVADRDYLLLTWDEDSLSGVGFRAGKV